MKALAIRKGCKEYSLALILAITLLAVGCDVYLRFWAVNSNTTSTENFLQAEEGMVPPDAAAHSRNEGIPPPPPPPPPPPASHGSDPERASTLSSAVITGVTPGVQSKSAPPSLIVEGGGSAPPSLIVEGEGSAPPSLTIKEEAKVVDPAEGDEHPDVFEGLVKDMVDGWESKYAIAGNGDSNTLVDREEGTGERTKEKSGKSPSSVVPAAAPAGGGGGGGGEERRVREIVRRLLTRKPPHLSDCTAEETRHAALDRRKSDGSLPDWASDKASQDGGPLPPWIRGANGDNLPLTRAVQRDIWVHQHPANCSDPKVRFVVAEWWGITGHGIGSQLHGMTAFLAWAITNGRVLVPMDNFLRADQEKCVGGSRNRLACYFVEVTSEECSRRALALMRAWKGRRWTGRRGEQPVVVERGASSCKGEVPRLKSVGRRVPWKEMRKSIVYGGQLLEEGDLRRRLSWWRAQALRYLLRWPTRYMCGIINGVRNRAFGKGVGRTMLGVATRLSNGKLYFIDSYTKSGHHNVLDNEKTRTELAATGLLGSWRRGGGGDGGEEEERELFMPRPFASIHVRLGQQKLTEMSLFGLPTFMRIAEALRKEDGNLDKVWLSTEVESVIEQSRKYSAWRFFYSHQKRIRQDQNDFENEFSASSARATTPSLAAGTGNNNLTSTRATRATRTTRATRATRARRAMAYANARRLPNFDLVEKSFANLLISSEADYFIGTLGSNWCRLIDELRKTNGRDSRKYIAVNYGQW